jgi:NADPH2:quinone reductase
VRCVVYTGTGGPEVVSVEDRPDPEPAKFEVVIAPAFAGLNPADVLQREGRHPVPPGSPTDIPGLEVAGAVVAVGAAVTAFEVGDRAMGLVGGGGLATRVIANERELAAVPDTLDDAQAAAVPEAFVTAFDAIVLQAGLLAGDMLLVNGASGGVGTAAVQIARALGARVVANVRSEHLRPAVAALGAEALSAERAFQRVAELGGADVILELVGGPHMADNIAALGRRGRLIVVGSKPGEEVSLPLRDLMTKRAHLIGTSLRTRPPEEKGQLMQAFARRVVPLLAAGTIAPLVDRTFSIDDVVAALDAVRAPGKLGKLLLELPA